MCPMLLRTIFNLVGKCILTSKRIWFSEKDFNKTGWMPVLRCGEYVFIKLTRRVHGDRVTDFFKLCEIKDFLCGKYMTKPHDPLFRKYSRKPR